MVKLKQESETPRIRNKRSKNGQFCVLPWQAANSVANGKFRGTAWKSAWRGILVALIMRIQRPGWVTPEWSRCCCRTAPVGCTAEMLSPLQPSLHQSPQRALLSPRPRVSASRGALWCCHRQGCGPLLRSEQITATSQADAVWVGTRLHDSVSITDWHKTIKRTKRYANNTDNNG